MKVKSLLMTLVAMLIALPSAFAGDYVKTDSDRVVNLGEKDYKMYYVFSDGNEYPVYVDGIYVRNANSTEASAAVFHFSAPDSAGLYKISLAGTNQYWQFDLKNGLTTAANAGNVQVFTSEENPTLYWINLFNGSNTRTIVGKGSNANLDYYTRAWSEGQATLYAGQAAEQGSWNSEVRLVEVEEMYHVTYNYVFEGNIVKTDSLVVPGGDPRPTASAPYACEVDLSEVPDYITEDGTYNITVTKSEEFPFDFSESYEKAKWYTWRMANREGGTASYKGYVWNNGTKLQQTDLDEQPTQAKYLFAFVGSPFSFKMITTDNRYVYTTAANNSDVVIGDEGTDLSIQASTYDPESAWPDYDKMFYFNAIGFGGGINEMGKNDVDPQGNVYRKVGYWTGGGVNDNGSLIAVEPVEEIMIYQVEFNEGAPAAGGALGLGEVELAPNGPCNAISTYDELEVSDVEPYEVEGYDVAVTLEGRVFTVTYTPNRSLAWLMLSGLIQAATEIPLPEGPWGTDPGYYDQEAVEAFPDSIQSAIDVLEAEEGDESYMMAFVNLTTAIAAIQPHLPEVGKVYMMVNGFPTFEDTHGYKMAIYSTGSVMRWKGIDQTNPAFYWLVTDVKNDTITFQNLLDASYPKGYTTANQPIPLQADVNTCTIAPLGEAQFNIKSVGSSAVFHAGNHGQGSSTEGNIMIWDAGVNSCSSWYITEVTTLDVPFYGEYSTLMVPFDAELPEGMTAYTVPSMSGNGTLDLTPATSIEANKPYVVKGEADATYTLTIGNITTASEPVAEGLLTGVRKNTEITAGAYYFVNEEGYDCFMKFAPEGEEEEAPVAEGAHCYIRDLGCQADVLYFDPALAIENLSTSSSLSNSSQVIYNLAGQKMNNLQKGINIVDGKKVIK